MVRYLWFAVATIVVGVVAGCGGNDGAIRVGPGMTYRSTNERYECTAEVKGGKLTWATKAINELGKRGYCRGIITLHTDVNMIVNIEFETSVEAKTTLPVGESDVVVEGMPKTWNVINKNACVIPGAGCETPTTHIAANWPVTPFKATYKAEPIVVKAERDIGPLSCKVEKLEPVTLDHKLVTVTFTLVSEVKAEVIYKITVTTTTDDGRADSTDLAYSLLPGEKKDVKCTLAFARPFKSSDTKVHVDGKVKAEKQVTKK